MPAQTPWRGLRLDHSECQSTPAGSLQRSQRHLPREPREEGSGAEELARGSRSVSRTHHQREPREEAVLDVMPLKGDFHSSAPTYRGNRASRWGRASGRPLLRPKEVRCTGGVAEGFSRGVCTQPKGAPGHRQRCLRLSAPWFCMPQILPFMSTRPQRGPCRHWSDRPSAASRGKDGFHCVECSKET